MRFSHAWLKTYVAIREEPPLVGARLTACGITLDGIEGRGDEAVYDFDIFANRPDCMSHLGLAREYAASTGEPLRKPDATLPAPAGSSAPPPPIAIEAPDLCRRYSARVISGIRVGESPAWLRERLTSIGARPINNVVDATNFVLWELGHPLHAFDLDRLEGGRVLVRRAASKEKLLTLDGVERALDATMLVIADARRPVGLAGVMGGRASEITAGTRRVLLESAWFDPVSIRRTSRALGLHTDASHRFERGADPEGTLAALDRAASIIAEVASGRVEGGPIDLYPAPVSRPVIAFRPARASALLGVTVDPGVAREALTRREFAIAPQGADLWRVTVPSFRRDVTREVDLIEEVARHRGYADIPSARPLLPDDARGRPRADRIARAARAALMQTGFSEAVNYSMVDRDEAAAFEGGEPYALTNPLQAQSGFLRTSLLPGLIRNLAHNFNHGQAGCHLFEVGLVFRRRGERPDERQKAAFVLSGRAQPVHWSLPRREVDFYDARGALERLTERIDLSPAGLSSDRIGFLEPGRAWSVAVEGRIIGYVGEIERSLRERLGVDRPVFAAEIDLTEGRPGSGAPRQFRPLARFPSVRRDLALLVGSGVGFAEVERIVRATSVVPIAEILPFDRYAGPGMPKGTVSLAVQITFQHPERTLSADEVQTAQNAIVAALERELGARLRGPAAG